MNVKFKQSVYLNNENRVFNVNDEAKLDKKQAIDLINAGYAEEVVVEKKPSVKKAKAADK